jgi:putative flavoprotein involved in K+ transport
MEIPMFDGDGSPWLHAWGSGRFSGMARDAAFIAERITERLGAAPPVLQANAD